MNSKKDLVMVQTRIPRKNHEQLKKMSVEYGISINAIVNFAVSQYLQVKDFVPTIKQVDSLLTRAEKLKTK